MASIIDVIEKKTTTKRITLITGSENRLWHRDSIDLMYEWLRNGADGRGARDGRTRLEKHVLSGYRHQELLWGTHAPRHVYPLIARGVE